MSVAKKLSWAIGLAALFIVLSPGVLLTVPAREQGWWTPNMPSTQVLVHAVVFVAAWMAIKMMARRGGRLTASSASSSVKSAASSAASTTTKAAKQAAKQVAKAAKQAAKAVGR